jgi:hypothetical protein
MEYYQMSFLPTTNVEELSFLTEKLKKEIGNIRRGFFSRHEEILERLDKLEIENRLLKAEIQELREEKLQVVGF